MAEPWPARARQRLGAGSALLLLLIVPLLAWPAPAPGHDARHDFESVITGLTPARLGAGIEVRILDYDEQIELVNRGAETVVVRGYEGEPYARIEPSGPVFLNVRSPSVPLSNDRWGQTPPTGDEDAEAPPRWVRAGEGGTLAWYDRRMQDRRGGIPTEVTDTGARQALRDYRIPLVVGGQRAAINGTLYWSGRSPFPIAGFVAMLLVTAAVTLLAARALRPRAKSETPTTGSPVAS